MRRARVKMKIKTSWNYRKERLVWTAQMSSVWILRDTTHSNQLKMSLEWFRIFSSNTTPCKILSIVRTNFWTSRQKLVFKPLFSWATCLITLFRWTQLCGLLFRHLCSIASILTENFSKHKIWLKGKNLIQLTSFRINVSMSNFVDMLIDYPNSKVYASDMFDKLLEMGVMTKDQN